MVKKFLGNLVICFGICWLISTGISIFISFPAFSFDELTPITSSILLEIVLFIGVAITLVVLIKNLHTTKGSYENDKKCGTIMVILACICALRDVFALFTDIINFFKSSGSIGELYKIYLFDNLFATLINLWPAFIGFAYTKKKKNEAEVSGIENNNEDEFYRKSGIWVGLYLSILILFTTAIRITLLISNVHASLSSFIVQIIFVALLTILVIVFCMSYFGGEETEERYQKSTNILIGMGALILITHFVTYLLNFRALPDYFDSPMLLETILELIIGGFVRVVISSFVFFIGVCTRNTGMPKRYPCRVMFKYLYKVFEIVNTI